MRSSLARAGKQPVRGQFGAARHAKIFQRAEKEVRNMIWWNVRAIIRTTEIVSSPFLGLHLEYDTFIVGRSVLTSSRKKAIEEAEMHFYKKYGIGVNVILIGATRVKF